MELNTVIEGDCLEVMRGFPDKSFDLCLTDPPYGLDFKGEDWDSFIPRWIEEAQRVAKIVIFTTAPTTMWDYPRPDWVLCWYREAAQSRSQLGGGFNHWSPILVYGKPKFQIDSIKLHAIANATYVNHPSPKPVKLFEWIIGNATEKGQSILDPFAGSGTTGIAARNLKRNFVLIEKDPEYAKICRERLASTPNPMF